MKIDDGDFVSVVDGLPPVGCAVIVRGRIDKFDGSRTECRAYRRADGGWDLDDGGIIGETIIEWKYSGDRDLTCICGEGPFTEEEFVSHSVVHIAALERHTESCGACGAEYDMDGEHDCSAMWPQ